MAKARKLFYLNGQIHRRLLVNRGKDLMYAWNYPEHCRNVYTYSDVLRRMEPAFSSTEVAKMLMRGRSQVEKAIYEGHVEFPQKIYSLDTGKNTGYMWSEEDILGLLDYFASVHYGRPRKDGIVVPKDLPTPREVRAMIRDDKVLYGRADYTPSFRAKNIKGEK